MSDVEKSTTSPTTGPVPQFTDRELQLLTWAMQSLKSGPPEIDYEKLANFAGMGNPRSAGNAWAKLKGKLMDNAATPSTPKKPRKKATKGNVDEDGEATPKMTPASRKRVQKKQDVDGDASPKKKTRVVKSEPKVESEEEETVAEAPTMKADPDELADDEV